MGIQEIFGILGIDETKDEKLIQGAYRKLLVKVNPEDDQEGFRRLREAYEQALAYARTPDEEDGGIREADWLQDGPVGAFLKNVADVYGCMPRRLDAEEWKALTEDPVLQDLDDGESAKWGMFSYLAENYRLPERIWRLLDGAFFIEENQQEFREKLPNGFVDFILERVHQEESQDFPYEKFHGAPDADYDGFMNLLFALIRERNEETPEGLAATEKKLRKLDAFGILHPWCELERARYLFRIGEKEEAKSMARRLYGENREDERTCLTSASILLSCGHSDEAYEIYERYLSGNRTDYGAVTALYNLAYIEAERENWEKARDFAGDARNIQENDEVLAFIREVSQKLIEQYTAKAEELTEDEADTLGWCFVDTERGSEGAAFFGAHPEYPKDTRGWHKLLTALYWNAGAEKETLKEAEQWRYHIRKELEDARDTEGLQKELALNYFVSGRTLRNLYRRKASEEETLETEKLYVQAMEAYEQAIGLSPENLEFRMNKVILLRDKKDYRKVVDECEEILKRDGQYFWACAYMQEAYEGLRMAQEVVDTFYRAKRIYAGNAEIYLRAVKVFVAYDQYKDALGILNQAAEAGVDGNHLLILEKMNVLNHLAEDEESWQTAKNFAYEALKKLSEEDAGDEILSKAFLRRALLYETAKEDKEKWLKASKEDEERALELQDTAEIRYFLGRNCLKFQKEPKAAYKHLKICEERGMTFEWMYFYIAQCHEDFQEWNEAIEYYKKVMEVQPEFRDCYWRIGWLYRRKYIRTEQLWYAEQALHYINLQQEKFGDRDQPYRWRANIYMRLREYEKALSEIEIGLEKDSDSGMWFLKGQNLRYSGRYEEAITCYENSIRAEDRYGESDENSYRNIFQCFLRMRRLDEGIAYFEKELEKDLPDNLREKCMENLTDLEAESGHYDRALLWLEKRYGGVEFKKRCCDSWEREADRLEDVLDVWQDFQLYPGDELKRLIADASVLAEEAYRDEEGELSGRALMCHDMGERYYYCNDYETSLLYFEKALELAKKADRYDHFKGLWRCLMRACYWMGDMKKAEEYGKEYRKTLEKTYQECSDLGMSMEELMTSPGVSRNNLYELFCWAYFTGRKEKAREYLTFIETRDMCYWCDEDGCTELWEMKGLEDILEGRKEEALKNLEIASRVCWLGIGNDISMLIRMLEAEQGEHAK